MNRFKTMGQAELAHRREGTKVRLTTVIPIKLKKRGVSRVIQRPDNPDRHDPLYAHELPSYDNPLQVALSRAFYWHRLIEEGHVTSGSEIARREGLHPSTVNELLRLRYLSPVIIQKILAGQQPRCLSLAWLQRNALPGDWQEQERVMSELRS